MSKLFSRLAWRAAAIMVVGAGIISAQAQTAEPTLPPDYQNPGAIEVYDIDRVVPHPINEFPECDGMTFTDYEQSEECLAIMSDGLDPQVIDIPRDGYTMGQYSYWHVTTEGAANVYDAPAGNVIRQIEPGFNFVIATDVGSNPGWIGIQGGGWMSENDISYYQASEHRGAQVMDGLARPFGWVMHPLFPSAYPGGQQETDNGRFMNQYDRFTVFGQVADEEGIIWYLVGPNQWIEQRSVAIAKPTERPEEVEGRWIAVDLYEQTLIGYEDDTPVFATLVATGLPNWDTRQGVFSVWTRAIRDPMSGATGSPAAYALQDVPWVMYFDGGISIHGTYWHNGFGYRRSHGCVNLSISDARFVYEWTNQNPANEEGNPETFVYVYSSGLYGQFGITQG